MKKAFAILLIVLLVAALFPVPALAETADDALYDYEELKNGTIRITKYKGEGFYDVVIPSTLGSKGWPVTEIDKNAFIDNAEIETLVIPDSVTRILGNEAGNHWYDGDGAFRNCTKLKTVHISNNLKYLGRGAFRGCWRLESIAPNNANAETGWFVLPDSLEEIWDYAFYNCAGLINIKLPPNLKILRIGAFQDCKSLLEVNVPGTVKDIFYGAFINCDSLQKAVLNEGTLNIISDGYGAFVNCPKLTEVRIPASVSFIAGDTFDYSPKVEIYCAKGTYAYKWAEENGVKIHAALMAPDGVPKITSVTADNTSTTVKWDGVDGVSGYEVYRSTDGSNYVLMVTTASTSWKNDGLAPGATYYYKVLAYNESGGNVARGSFSNVKKVTTEGAATSDPGQKPAPQPAPKPDKPGGVKAAPNGPDKITVTWSSVSGAKSYQVWRSVNGITFSPLKNTNKKTFVDTKLKTGTKYYYKVRAVGTKNAYGQFSKIVSATPKLSKPTTGRAQALTGGAAKVTWSGVAGASGYVLERSTNKTRGFKPVKTQSSRTFINKGLAKGKTYYYRVRAYKNVDGKKIPGPYSKVFGVKAK